jgi:hypothetical protein
MFGEDLPPREMLSGKNGKKTKKSLEKGEASSV